MANAHYRIDAVRIPSIGMHPWLVRIGNGDPGGLSLLANLWAYSLRATSRPNTIRSYLFDIARFVSWDEGRGGTFLQELRFLRGLPANSASSLSLFFSMASDGEPVTSSTFRRRQASIASFIEFCFGLYIDLSCEDRASALAGERRLQRQLKHLRRLRPMLRPATERPTTHLSVESIRRIELAMRPPPAPNVPSRSSAIRWRNYCILKVAIAAWARRSELVLLTLNDVELGANPTLLIRTGLVGGMERRDGAAVKTMGRLVPLNGEVARLLSRYLEEFRPLLVRPEKPSASLFPSSRDGQRLSSKTINSLFFRVANELSCEGEPVRVHPHALRKAAANQFLRSFGVARPRSETIEAMNYLAGWSSGQMAAKYAREAIDEHLGRLIRGNDENDGQ